MIKRPLVWILGAYIAGMYLAWQKAPGVIVLSASSLVPLVIYLLIYRFRNSFINRKDIFLWCLPVMILLGFFATKSQLSRPELDQAFDEKAECSLSGKITMIAQKSWGKALYVKDNSVYLSRGEPYLCENVIVYSYDDQTYRVGNSIQVSGTILKFSEAANPGQFNERMYYQIENIDYKVKADSIRITNASYSKFHNILDMIKNKLMRVYETILPPKESGALIAMLLGEKQLLDDEIKQLYQENGISHVLAISGLHVSLIGLFIYKLFKKLKLGIIPATVLSIIFIYSYGVLTNFSVSTNRAVVMIIVMMLSKIFGKTYDMLSSTALSALIILLQNPLQIFQAGFLLSYGAVLGIALVMPSLSILFPSKKLAMSGLLISISAQVMTLPMILCFYYQLPVYSLIVNLLILPFMSIEILTALAAGIVGTFYMPLGIFLIGAADYILKFTEWLCRIGSSLPGNLFTVGKPDMLRILIYVALLIFFLWSVRRYQKKLFILILAAAVTILIIPKHHTGLEITMLDVGQGEGIFIENGAGSTYLIDGGSSDIKNVGAYRLQPFLLYKGVDCVDYAIISHSDADHTSGLAELIQGDKITIKNLIMPYITEQDDSYVALEKMAAEKGIRVQYIKTGDYIKDGPLNIICLHPSSDNQTNASTGGNTYSTVLSVSYGEFDMLFTGDIDQSGEKELVNLFQSLDSGPEYTDKNKTITVTQSESTSYGKPNQITLPTTDYDVLKVAHHGSKYSTYMDFLQIVKPEISLISCGKNNMYGHPHKELLDRLKQMESNVMITYETGAISVWTDGMRMKTSEYKRT